MFKILSFIVLFLLTMNVFADNIPTEMAVTNHTGHYLKFYKIKVSTNPLTDLSYCEHDLQDIKNNESVSIISRTRKDNYLDCQYIYLLEDKRTEYIISIFSSPQKSIVNDDLLDARASYFGGLNNGSYNGLNPYQITSLEYYPIDPNLPVHKKVSLVLNGINTEFISTQ